MSCELHRIGAMVENNVSRRVVDTLGTRLQLPAGAEGKIRAILQDRHELVVYFPEIDREITVAANTVGGSGHDRLAVVDE